MNFLSTKLPSFSQSVSSVFPSCTGTGLRDLNTGSYTYPLQHLNVWNLAHYSSQWEREPHSVAQGTPSFLSLKWRIKLCWDPGAPNTSSHPAPPLCNDHMATTQHGNGRQPHGKVRCRMGLGPEQKVGSFHILNHNPESEIFPKSDRLPGVRKSMEENERSLHIESPGLAARKVREETASSVGRKGGPCRRRGRTCTQARDPNTTRCPLISYLGQISSLPGYKESRSEFYGIWIIY